MSSQPATTTTTQQQSSTPLGGAQRNLFNDVWGNTTGTLNKDLSTPIPQNTVAGATAPQYQGAQEMLNVAPQLGQNAQDTSNLVGRIASGYYSNPMNDPNFQGAAKSALAPSFQQLTEQILPGVTDASLRAGGSGTGPSAYGGTGGGSPQDIMTQEALRNWSQTANNTVGSMAEDAYKSGLGLFSQIPGLATSGISQALAPSLATEQAGSLLQGFNQSDLTNLLQRYSMNTGLPFSFLNSAAGIGSQGGFGNKNTYGTSVGPPPSMATQLLQGGLGGAGAANALFGSGPAGAPSAISNIGSGIGSGASWLSGLLQAAPMVAAA